MSKGNDAIRGDAEREQMSVAEWAEVDDMILRSLAAELAFQALMYKGKRLGTTGHRLHEIADRIATLTSEKP